jgi:hypothetical protein
VDFVDVGLLAREQHVDVGIGMNYDISQYD